jgi:hypothetical protein
MIDASSIPPIPVPADNSDMVNHPPHYTKGGIECIDAIAASMTIEEFRGFLHGQVMKYVWRYKYKNGREDLEKAEFYLKRLINTL